MDAKASEGVPARGSLRLSFRTLYTGTTAEEGGVEPLCLATPPVFEAGGPPLSRHLPRRKSDTPRCSTFLYFSGSTDLFAQRAAWRIPRGPLEARCETGESNPERPPCQGDQVAVPSSRKVVEGSGVEPRPFGGPWCSRPVCHLSGTFQ